MKKDININTAAFSLTIHWNSNVFGTQAAMLFGLGLLKMCAGDNTHIDLLCNVLLIIDVVSILWYLFKGHKEEVASQESPAQNISSSPSHEPPPTVEANSQEQKQSQRKERGKSAPPPREITNKLEIARPKPGANHPQPTPAPVPVPAPINDQVSNFQVPPIQTMSAPAPESFSDLFSAATVVETPPAGETSAADEEMDFDFDFDFDGMG